MSYQQIVYSLGLFYDGKGVTTLVKIRLPFATTMKTCLHLVRGRILPTRQNVLHRTVSKPRK